MDIIGIDLGATKIAAGLVRDGRIVRTITEPTDSHRGPRDLTIRLGRIISDLAEAKIPKHVGIGMAGMTDPIAGVFLGGPNFPSSFRNFAVAKDLHDLAGVTVCLDNDAHCFALGEATYGAGKGASRVLGVTVGTGIGGGIVQDGRVVSGGHNTAAEIGHMTVRMDDDAVCGCGKKGHLEAYASGTGIARAYRELTGKPTLPSDIAARAGKGEKKAKTVFDDAARALAVGIATAIHAFDPDIVVVGGGMAKGPLLWSSAKRQIGAHLLYPKLKRIPVKRSTLWSDAGIMGAAALHGYSYDAP